MKFSAGNSKTSTENRDDLSTTEVLVNQKGKVGEEKKRINTMGILKKKNRDEFNYFHNHWDLIYWSGWLNLKDDCSVYKDIQP